jgi:thiamine biosynthesis lipoprotein
MEHADWRALGTGVRLIVHHGDLAAARAAVEDLLDRVDRTYSRFRPDSELMRIHATRGRTVAVSPLLARAVGGALDAAARTGGAVDPTVGRAMCVIGYDADFDFDRGRIGRPSLVLRAGTVPGWSTVGLDVAARTLRIPADVELDLGSTGKGLAADLAAETALAAAGPGAGVLVGLGGDIATAGRAPDGGWRITVVEDSAIDPGDALAAEVIAIGHGAVATSSTTVRRWRAADGVTVHHIVDPRTGGSALVTWRTATVVAGTCEAANAASTAAIVLGDAARAWLEAAGYPARLVARDGSVVRIGGWPKPIARTTREQGAEPGREPERPPGRELVSAA